MRITTGEGSHFTQPSFDTVKLSNARQADGGDYVCEARMGNNVLNRSQPVTLVFCSKWLRHSLAAHIMFLSPTAQPTITGLPAPMTHTEREHFELICSFTGIPNPEIHWEKDGSVFLLGEERRVINNTADTTKTSQLEISSLLLSDAGMYTCSVTNVANMATSNGMDSRSVRLEVRGEESEVMNVSNNKHLTCYFFLLTLHSHATTNM